MDKDIKKVFQRYLPDLKFDKKLYMKIQKFRIGWMQKSDDYMEFLGGNLLGVQPIRFSSVDDEKLFVDIFNIDMHRLKVDLHNLEGINPDWKVTSNTSYLTLGYLMHMFMTSKDIGKYKDSAVMEIYFIFAYKKIGSLISNGFKFPANRNLAMATYEKLSNRFLIKKLGSWQAVFEHRAKDIYDKNGLHYKAIQKYTTENAVTILSDIDGRIREAFKNVYRVMEEIRLGGDSVIKTTSTIETDANDEDGIKSLIDRPDKYLQYMNSVVIIENDFIKNDLIHLITLTLPSTQPDILVTVLKYISNEKKISIIDPILSQSIEYLNIKLDNQNYKDNVMEILLLLKNYWGSSKTKNKNMLSIKKEITKIVIQSTPKKAKWVRTTSVLGTLLYIFLRSISKY